MLQTLDGAPDVLTPDEVGEVLRLGRNSVYERIRTGAIPSIRLGRKLLVPRVALERLLGKAPASEALETRTHKRA